MADDTEQTTQETQGGSLSLLAREKFGESFTGEVREAPPETPTEETGTEAPAETPEEGEETPGEGSEETREEPAEEQEYELSHIAQLLGVEESNLSVTDEGRVILQGKVDGAPVQAPVKDLLDNYQMLQAADKRLEDSKSKAKAQAEEMAKKSEALEGQFATAAKLIEKAESLLDEEAKGIDWKALREEDNAEYAAKKQEFAERKQQIEQAKNEALQEYQQAKQLQQQETQERYAQYLQEQQQQLLQKLPEWQDDEKAKAEKSQLVDYLLQEGFTREDVNQAADHRLIVMARKAMMFDQMQKSTATAKKKVAKVPKAMKPGTTKPQEQVDREKVEKQRQKLKQSGSLDDAFELLRASRG